MITVCFIDTFYRLRYRFFVLFLQLCNLLCKEITAAALSWTKAAVLALVNLVPFAAVWVTYILVRKGVVLEELQYRKK